MQFLFVFFFQLIPRVAGETLFKRNEYLMFQKEVFLVGCNVCFRSEYNFSVCTEEEEEKKGFFRIDYIPENYAEVSILIFQIYNFS